MTDPTKRQSRKKRAEMRRTARSWALSMLYALEYRSSRPPLFSHFPELIPRAKEASDAFAFARELTNGVVNNRLDVDQRIQGSSPRWKVGRMAMIDRNILRLATYELFFSEETPPKVIINEAVELAKRFGAEKTRGFVNGILQQICVDNDVSMDR